MIYTITLNSAIDYYLSYTKPLSKHQVTTNAVESIGGKGLNAAVILQNLAVPYQAVFVVGGSNGKKLEALVQAAKLSAVPVWHDGQTRINVKTNFNGSTYEFNAAGSLVNAAAINASVIAALSLLNQNDQVMIMGSLPLGYKLADLIILVEFVKSCKADLVFDLSQDLLQLLKYQPLLIKPNRFELAALFNVSINSNEEALFYGQKLVALGAKNVLVSLGEAGAIFANKDTALFATPLLIKEVNASGAGDSMLATALACFVQNLPLIETLQMAVGAGTATAASVGLASAKSIRSYAKQVSVLPMPGGVYE